MDLANAARAIAISDKRPTARERWAAFWRLWRMAQGGHPWASEAWRVLCWRNWKWIQIAEACDDPLLTRRLMPKQMRRERIELERTLRLRKEDEMRQRLLNAIFAEE